MRSIPILLTLLATWQTSVSLAQDTSATSDVVVVRPGKLHRFAVTAGGTASAGSNIEIVLEALDAQGNRITDSAGIDGEFRVETGGRASATPALFTGALFQNGLARIIARDERAESIAVLFTRSTGAVLGQTRDIRVLPAELDRFQVKAPSSVTAGLPARVDLEAQDRYGNRVSDLGASRELPLTSDGSGIFEPGSVPAAVFQDGRATFAVTYRVAESVRLTVAASGGKRGTSEAIVVKAAAPHHFSVEAATTVVAGRPFSLTLKAFDAFNNPMTDYARVGGDALLSRSGEGAIEPRLLEVARFRDGTASVPVTVFNAGTFRIRVTARGGEINNESEVLRAEPGEAARFEIENAATGTVKEPLAVKVSAFDAWGNAGATIPGTIRIADDAGLVSPATLPATSFARGVAYTMVTADRVGRAVLVATLEGGRARSTGPAVDIGPGAPSRLAIEVPPSVIAGEPFEVTVTAFDAWNNVVTDFDVRGRPVSVGSRSDGPLLLPYRVLASQFESGRARIQPVVERAGPLRIDVNDESGRLSATSETITVRTSRPDHFTVEIPSSAVAGSPFEVKLEARDRFENRITDYEKVGQDVRLEVEGLGKLDPPIVPARSFRDGISTVSVTYDRAERLVVRPRFASLAGDANEGNPDNVQRDVAPIAREPRGASGPEPTPARTREPQQPRPTPPAQPPAPTPAAIIHESTIGTPRTTPAAALPTPPLTSRTPAPPPRPTATPEPQPSLAVRATPVPCRPAMPTVTPAPSAPRAAAAANPEAVRTASATPTPIRAATSTPTPTPARAIPSPSPQRTPAATPKLSPLPTATRTPPAAPVAKPAAGAPAAGTPAVGNPPLPPPAQAARRGEAVTVRRIRFEETATSAKVHIETAGELQATVSPEFRYGTEWITLSLSPVANDLTALLGKIQSKTFGATEVKSNDRTAVLAFELLAEQIDYHVTTSRDGVTVTFTRADGN